MKNVKETYHKTGDFMKGNPQEGPLVHKKKKGNKQENIKYEFKGGFHDYISSVF